MAFHINKFDSVEEYQTFVQTHNLYPQLYLAGTDGKVYWPSQKSDDPCALPNALKFTSSAAQTISFNDVSGTSASFEISDDGKNWSSWDKTSHSFNGSVYVRGTNPSGFGTTSSSYAKFVFGDSTVPVSVSGNIMHLINYETNITTIPSDYCFRYLFHKSPISDASNLILPATTLTIGCYSYMFAQSKLLTSVPALPAKTMTTSCYEGMFANCSLITTAPELPATTLAYKCYMYMFYSCSALNTPPELPVRNLATSCYSNMFGKCSSLVSVPALPATTLEPYCYVSMFADCTGIITPPTLPATTLADGCYYQMFINCSHMTSAPTLPVMSLAKECYAYMFCGCTSLTTAPELPATTLAESCYQRMFNGCSALTTAPVLPAETLTATCYNGLFNGCSSLASIKCLATDISADNCTTVWVSGVAASGTFTKAIEMTSWTTGNDGIPTNWVVEPKALKFTSSSAQSISFTDASGASASLEISTDGDNWSSWDKTEYPFNGSVYVRGTNPSGFGNTASSNAKFVFGDSSIPVTVSGNIMHLLDHTQDLLTIPCNFAFRRMFSGSAISDASKLKLPATTLTEYCYSFMFQSSSLLTSGPTSLPAMTMVTGCYCGMFSSCSSLTTIMELPATTLAESCYSQMFVATSITTPPVLSCMNLAQSCYELMFSSCNSLTTPPELPATTLAINCYSSMFRNCTSITTAPDLPATTLPNTCYFAMFSGCTNLASIKCLATSSAENSTTRWVKNVAASGTFTKASAATFWTTGVAGIPENWTVVSQ